MKRSRRPPVLPESVIHSNVIYKKCSDLYDASLGKSTFQFNFGHVITAEQLAQVPHLEWVPADILEFCHQQNGFTISWDADIHSDLARRGEIRIMPLEIMFHDWEGEIYWRQHLTPRDAHMEHFKVVDNYTGDAVVGLFHTPARDPELYYFDREDTFALGVDFAGYLALLTYTLGCVGWLTLLRALGPATVDPRPFRPTHPAVQQALDTLQAAVSGFDLDAFVACYDQVRLQTPAT